MEQAAIKSSVGTVILDVNLDTTANPPVQISNRNQLAASGDKIKWKKQSGAPDFKFTDFQPQSSPFNNVSISDDKIECDFSTAAPGGTEFPYTITVEYDGQSYTSDEAKVKQPDEGRAVIRN